LRDGVLQRHRHKGMSVRLRAAEVGRVRHDALLERLQQRPAGVSERLLSLAKVAVQVGERTREGGTHGGNVLGKKRLPIVKGRGPVPMVENEKTVRIP
jgi:hypothetical protein